MKTKGVTLVELLVAVALLALLMVAFYTVFRTGTKAYQTGEKRVEIIQNARVAFDRMVSEIRQAMPEVGGNPDVVFQIGGGTSKEGTWITFYAPLDGTEGAEKIQFSRYSGEPGTGDETNTLYKRVLNPPYQTSEGGYSSHNPGSQQITAAMPGTEGIVTYLYFEERPPVGVVHSGLIRITMKFKADPTDANEFVLHDIVKAGFCYGIGMGGGF
jgi:prepilin-type N-terminal cleavage/methylation domain-containing protein